MAKRVTPEAAAAPAASPMVKVESIKYHTNGGQAYEVGDTYDVAEDAVDNLVNQGMAVRVDRVAQAKRAQKAAVKPAAAPRARKTVGRHKS